MFRNIGAETCCSDPFVEYIAYRQKCTMAHKAQCLEGMGVGEKGQGKKDQERPHSEKS